MKKLMLMVFAAALMISGTALAQETMKHDDMKSDNPKAEKMSKGAVAPEEERQVQKLAQDLIKRLQESCSVSPLSD